MLPKVPGCLRIRSIGLWMAVSFPSGSDRYLTVNQTTPRTNYSRIPSEKASSSLGERPDQTGREDSFGWWWIKIGESRR